MQNGAATRNCLYSLAFAVSLFPGNLAAQKADLVFINANILTVDKDFSKATALAIKAGKIMAVGSNDDIRNLVGPRTRQIQLNGATVLPGLIETHVHALGVGLAARQRPYVELHSINGVTGMAPARSQASPAGHMDKDPTCRHHEAEGTASPYPN